MLAADLADYLERHEHVEGFTLAQLDKARYRLQEIESNREAADEFAEALERRYVSAGMGVADGLPDWLRWAIGVMANVVKFIVEHPALVKFLLTLLVGLLDERRDVFMPFPMGS